MGKTMARKKKKIQFRPKFDKKQHQVYQNNLAIINGLTKCLHTPEPN